MKLDINSISDGKAKDIILESIVRTENNLKQTEEFQKELFLNATLDDVNFLLKSIVDSKLDLIKVYSGNKTYVTSIGHINPFLKKGGFEKIEAELKKAESKEILEIENLKLQKEASEYAKNFRQKDEEIRNLTRDNLRLGNWDIRFRWYIAVFSFIIGFIIKYLIDK